MNNSQKIQKFIDYMPNCLICGKDLVIRLYPYISIKNKHLIIPIKIKNNILYNEFYNIQINLLDCTMNDNFLCSKRSLEDMEIKKCCTTCVFDIIANCVLDKNNKNKIKDFYLSHEIIKFTAPGINKPIEVINFYGKESTTNYNKSLIYLGDNQLDLQVDYLNLNNIKNFSSLKRKIKAALVFG